MPLSPTPNELKTSSPPVVPLDPLLRRSIHFSAWTQVPVCLLFSQLLDGGEAFRRALIAMVAQWVFVLFVVTRRPNKPTRIDIAWNYVGFVVLLAAICLVAPFASGWVTGRQ